MYSVNRRLDVEYFDFVEIDIRVDDLIIEEGDYSFIDVKLNINNTYNDLISNYLINGNHYDINLDIKDRILYVSYIKQDLMFLNETEHFEFIGCIISIPKDYPYKIINYEIENK